MVSVQTLKLLDALLAGSGDSQKQRLLAESGGKASKGSKGKNGKKGKGAASDADAA